MKHRSIAIAYAGVQVAVVLGIAFVAWLTSGWFIDDSVAFRLSDAGWWQIAAKRVAGWTVVASALGVVAFFVNRAVFARCGFTNQAALVLSIAVAAILFVGSAVGGAQFVIERPFM